MFLNCWGSRRHTPIRVLILHFILPISTRKTKNISSDSIWKSTNMFMQNIHRNLNCVSFEKLYICDLWPRETCVQWAPTCILLDLRDLSCHHRNCQSKGGEDFFSPHVTKMNFLSHWTRMFKKKTTFSEVWWSMRWSFAKSDNTLSWIMYQWRNRILWLQKEVCYNTET